MLKFTGGLRQFLRSCFILGVAIATFAIALPERVLAAPLNLSSALVADATDGAPEPDPAQGAKKAEKGAGKIYEGLEETKENIGKTEPRKDAMQFARDHASKRLERLADKAKAAEKGADTLTKVDKVNLDLMTNSQLDKVED